MIELRLSEIRAAIDAARARDDDWQAECCEVAMIPSVQAAWRAANQDRPFSVLRIEGIPHKGFEREGNLARCQEQRWAEVSGYLFDYGVEGVCWNLVRPGHYAHSAHSTWDGIARSTRHAMIEIARLAGGRWASREQLAGYQNTLATYGIALVDDRDSA